MAARLATASPVALTASVRSIAFDPVKPAARNGAAVHQIANIHHGPGCLLLGGHHTIKDRRAS